MPTFRLEDEQGRWLADVRLGAPTWEPGDRIWRGRDTLEVIAVRHDGDSVVLVVKGAANQDVAAKGTFARPEREAG